MVMVFSTSADHLERCTTVEAVPVEDVQAVNFVRRLARLASGAWSWACRRGIGRTSDRIGFACERVFGRVHIKAAEVNRLGARRPRGQQGTKGWPWFDACQWLAVWRGCWCGSRGGKMWLLRMALRDRRVVRKAMWRVRLRMRFEASKGRKRARGGRRRRRGIYHVLISGVVFYCHTLHVDVLAFVTAIVGAVVSAVVGAVVGTVVGRVVRALVSRMVVVVLILQIILLVLIIVVLQPTVATIVLVLTRMAIVGGVLLMLLVRMMVSKRLIRLIRWL